jgi:hypothetical protein
MKNLEYYFHCGMCFEEPKEGIYSSLSLARSCKIPSFSINRGTAPENLGEGNAASELKCSIFRV